MRRKHRFKIARLADTRHITDGLDVLVELVCSADTEKETHYYADGKIPGGETWHSLKFFFNRFKTEEGRLLRTPNLVNLLILHIDGEYLVNNILWL